MSFEHVRAGLMVRGVSAVMMVAVAGLTARGQTVPHNVILIVADGLRHGAVDTAFMPTFAELRRSGVDFVNSHSMMPTVTTPNASAIATGHYLGDTGEFGNTMFHGYPGVNDGWSLTHGMENDPLIEETNEHFGGNFIGEESLLAAARRSGFHTAVIGKHGPVLFQDITQFPAGVNGNTVQSVIMDDRTGYKGGVPLPSKMAERILKDGFLREKYFKGMEVAGDPPTVAREANGKSGTKVANVEQQQYYVDVMTHVILPSFLTPEPPLTAGHKPFVLVFWSRDPDGTQHAEWDNPEKLEPGVNGETVHKAFANVDNDVKQLVAYLKATPDANFPGKMLWETTNLFLTSDHGFATTSRGAIDAQLTMCESYASQQRYRDVPTGQLPQGCVAIDLAHDLGLPLFDPDVVERRASEPGVRVEYKKLRIESTATTYAEHPGGGGLLGGGTFENGRVNAEVIVCCNSGADLIYVPTWTAPEQALAMAKKVVARLAAKPYVSGIFVDGERFGAIPGALMMSDINLSGASKTIRPSIVVNMRSFSTDPAHAEMTGVDIADSGSRQGQGTHGSFGRHNTFNCMIAVGPDFKAGFSDTDPVSNADITNTLAHLLRMEMPSRGTLRGRVLTEALAGGGGLRGSERLEKKSAPAAGGEVTVLKYQAYKDEGGKMFQYFDAAGFAGRAVGIEK